MVIYVLVVLTSFIFFEACAQTKPPASGYVFIQQSFKGNIPVDEDGVPSHSGVDTMYFAVIELDQNDDLVIDSIRYNGRFIPASAFKIEEKSWMAGTSKNSNERLVIKAGENNTLWRIEFTGTGNNKSNYNETSIVKGKKNGSPFILELKEKVELLPLEKY